MQSDQKTQSLYTLPLVYAPGCSISRQRWTEIEDVHAGAVNRCTLRFNPANYSHRLSAGDTIRRCAT